MSTHARSGVVVFAKDLPRVARFYECTLAMDVVASARDHIILASAGLELVVHAIPKRIAASIEIAVPPQRRTQTPIKPFFFVASIAAVRAEAAALGGELNPPEGEWTARGFTACDGHDPEGNVVQFRQAVG